MEVPASPLLFINTKVVGDLSGANLHWIGFIIVRFLTKCDIIFVHIYLSITVQIYLSIYLYSYLSIYLSLFISIYLSLFISIYHSSYLSIYLYSYLSIYLSIFFHIYLSIFVHIYLSIYLSLFISIYLSITLHIYLSVHLSLFISIYWSIYHFALIQFVNFKEPNVPVLPLYKENGSIGCAIVSGQLKEGRRPSLEEANIGLKFCAKFISYFPEQLWQLIL